MFMIIAKKVLLSGLIATLLLCQTRGTDLSAQQKALAGTSFVVAGIFSGYLAYSYYQTSSSIVPSTLLNLFFSAPCTAIGGIMITNAISEAADQEIINHAYDAHCLAIKKYKAIIDRWNNGQIAFSELEPLITIPIDSYVFSLKKMICALHEQENVLQNRLLQPFENIHSEEVFRQLLHTINNTKNVLEQIHTLLHENSVYFIENLGEDSILEEVASEEDGASIEQVAVDLQMVDSELAYQNDSVVDPAILPGETIEEEAVLQEDIAEQVDDMAAISFEIVQEIEQLDQIIVQEEATEVVSPEEEIVVAQ